MFREKKSLTQEELADIIGVKRQSINQYEKDRIQPTKAKLALLAKALEVTIADLYKDIDFEKLPLYSTDQTSTEERLRKSQQDLIEELRARIKDKEETIESLRDELARVRAALAEAGKALPR